MEDTPTKDELQKRLMRVFKFDEDDLLANRAEMMSAKQKQLMRRYAILSMAIFAFIGIFFSVLIFIPTETSKREIHLSIPIFFIVSFTIIGALLFRLYWNKYKEGTVMLLNGTVEIQKKSGKTFLCIDGYSIHIDAKVDGLFQENAIYNVYYADSINHVMSVEKVS